MLPFFSNFTLSNNKIHFVETSGATLIAPSEIQILAK